MLRWLPRDGKLPAIAAPQPRLTLCLAQCLVTVGSHCAAFHHLRWPLQSSFHQLFLAFRGSWSHKRALVVPVTPAIIQAGKCHSAPRGVLMSSHKDGSGQFPFSSCLEILGQGLFPVAQEVCALPRWKFRRCRGA